MKHFNNEQWDASLGTRIRREAWEQEGSRDSQAKAKDRIKESLATHKPKPLEPDVKRKLREIVENAEI